MVLIRDFRRELQAKGQPAPHFSWTIRMDPQIRMAYGENEWVFRAYPEAFAELLSAGDSLGLHTHMYRWAESESTWVTDAADNEWCTNCVREGAAAFRRVFGFAPQIHSCGDRWLSNEALAAIEAEGVSFELSAEPGLTSEPRLMENELATGELPDWGSAPRSFWRPSKTDFRRADPDNGRDLLLMPVSMQRLPAYLEPTRWIANFRRRYEANRPSTDDRLQDHARVCLGHRPGFFRSGIRRNLARYDSGYFHFVLRTHQALEECGAANLRRNLNWIANGGSGSAVQFVTAAEAFARVGASAET